MDSTPLKGRAYITRSCFLQTQIWAIPRTVVNCAAGFNHPDSLISETPNKEKGPTHRSVHVAEGDNKLTSSGADPRRSL